jgi:putative N6-adenine-specific DNA methylase
VELYAPASPGTEVLLRDELCELGFQGVRLNRGGIPFRGDWPDAWRACLHSRIAQRIQALLSMFEADSPEALYDGVRAIDWTPYLTPRQTLAVSAFCRSSVFSHSGFTALKVKDAVVDQVRERCGRRPDIDKDDPDVRIFVYVSGTKAKVYLDVSGEPLHKRGYRTETGEAPLRETLAAALVRASGWDRSSQLADPMCGSGTIAIEAALWAGNIAPGIFRPRFGFERWECFDADAAQTMAALRGEARAQAHRQHPKILATDADAGVLAVAEANARAAGLRLTFRQNDIQTLQLGDAISTVVTNPPYDERLQTDLTQFREIGAAFSRMHGKRLCILAGNPELDRAIPVAPIHRFPLKNGNLDCECIVYNIP